MTITDPWGQRFGRLVVLVRASNNKHGRSRWLCQCDCGEAKVVNAGDMRSGKTNSCGCLRRETSRAALSKAPIALRFWDMVQVSSDDQCWEWQGELTRKGYGKIRVGSRKQFVHRVAWSLHHGREPEQWVLHHCDNRLCCNPAHLYEGVAADNTRDMLQAGRWRGRGTGPMTLEEDFATRGLRQSFN